jgi:GH25 family lysozyme M1 (1,4-beta-N-acetylmuramidase)
VYFFSQATSAEEAVEEARFLLDMLDGQELDMPIVFDWENVAEEEARTNNVDSKTLNACAQAFCKEIEAAGYDAMVYFYLSLAQWKLDLLALQQAGYDFWLALYSDKLSFRYQVQMWQYSNAGNVPGINTKVDLNLYFPGD